MKTIRDKSNWTQSSSDHLPSIRRMQSAIASGTATQHDYYFFPGAALCSAINCYLEGDPQKTKEAARLVVRATLEYFYGDWRKTLPTPDGKVGHEEWKPYCLWYDEVQRSLPFAAALSDWEAMLKIAGYPSDNSFPEAYKVNGGSAYVRALICFLRGDPPQNVENYLSKAETAKARRPVLLCPVLRALLDNDSAQFEKTLLGYLAYYRKSEFKLELTKLVSLDGTTLYHLGRKQGFEVELPENVADHVIRLK